jgi:HlyD family secretion protein
MNVLKKISLSLVIISLVFLSGCDSIMATTEEEGITASGVVEAVEVSIAPKVSGTVAELYVSSGDKLSAGDPVLLIENEALQAQYDQVLAAYDAARSGLETAKAGLQAAEAGIEVAELNREIAQVQYDLTLQLSRMQQYPDRVGAWNADSPNEFDLPVWYFSAEEEISAAEVEVDEARRTLRQDRANLEDVLDAASNADFVAAEQRLAEAQAAFLVVEELQKRQVEQNGRANIDDYVDSLYDAAEAELNSAQAEYDSLLSDTSADDVLEARARVVVAYERYQIALDQVEALWVGDQSLEVALAQLGIEQAVALVSQAEAALAQAQAGVDQAAQAVTQAEAGKTLVEIQVEDLTVRAPTTGVVLSSSVQVGELVQAGVSMMTVGKLNDLKITVYVAEDRYGQIDLGQEVEVTVDSFPDETFSATVTRIADRAEYTPRNVQTEEDRSTTVFAIELSVADTGGKLKPGMPADVVFQYN